MAKPKRRTGKSSKQKHQDQFHEKKNPDFLKTKMEEVQKCLFLTPDVSNVLDSLQFSTITKSTQVPLTTQEIRLLTKRCFEKAFDLKQPPAGCTVFSCYMALLAQLGEKVLMARRSTPTSVHLRPQLPLTFEAANLSLILRQQQNFMALTTVIIQIGYCQVGDIRYAIGLPDNTLFDQ